MASFPFSRPSHISPVCLHPFPHPCFPGRAQSSSCVSAVVNNAVNKGAQKASEARVNSFAQTPRSRIAGSHGSSVCNFLRRMCTVLNRGYASSHSNQWCARAPASPHPLRPSLSFDSLTVAILTREIYLIVTVSCISWTTGDVERLLLHLSAICTSSLERSLFQPLAYL